MEKAKKIKIFIGLFYLVAICLFLYFFFSKFSLQEITSYDFIKNISLYFVELKISNFFLVFFVFSIISYRIYKILYLLFIYLITIKIEILINLNHIMERT